MGDLHISHFQDGSVVSRQRDLRGIHGLVKERPTDFPVVDMESHDGSMVLAYMLT